MKFTIPKYIKPDFTQEPFLSAPNVIVSEVYEDGVAPENYHATSVYPEYYKVDGNWVLAKDSRMDCVPILVNNSTIEVVEFRNLKKGQKAIIGRSEDGSDGIYLHPYGFIAEDSKRDVFAFRSGRSRETAYTKDYNNLYEVLNYEKEKGYIVWVLGPAAVFDHDSRNALEALISNGFAHAILGGNAIATHDLEAGLSGTALGQNIYSQESLPNGHYNHLDLINKARKAGSLENLLKQENIKNGVIHAAIKRGVPLVLAGSIRDDGPLPSIMGDVYRAQDEMRKHCKKATTVICLATQLHTIATGNMTPSYTVENGKIRPVFLYYVDVSEFAVNKLRDRGTLEVTTIVTNVQDFLVNLKNNLIQ